MYHRPVLFLSLLLLLLPGSMRAQDWPDELPPEIIEQHFTPTFTAIRAGNLVDPETGTVTTNQIILTRFDPRNGQSEIVDIGPDVAIPDGAEIIELSDRYVLPGLVDTHDHLAHKNYSLDSRWEIEEPASVHHLKTARAIEESLAAGYTCIRDAGGLDAGFKLAIEQGLLNGPRLLTSVAIVSPTGCIGDRVSGS